MPKERVIRKRLADGTVKEYRYASSRTVGTVILEYKQSGEWDDLRPTTRLAYDHHLETIGSALHAVDITAIELGHILRMRDGLKDLPATANKVYAVWSVLLSFVLRRGYIKFHPMAGCGNCTRASINAGRKMQSPMRSSISRPISPAR